MNTLKDLFGLEGKTALVTGASSGLGVAFARALAGAGASLVLLARRLDRLEALATELEAGVMKESGARCLPLQADVSDDGQVATALERAEKEMGGVDILVNNAGIAPFGRAEKHSLDDWSRVMEVNVNAVYRLCRTVGGRMIESGRGGRIINLSSVMGRVANPIHPTVGYNTSKGAVEMLTRQLALEWAPHGITVNAIAPGWFPTEINLDPRHGDINPKQKEQMLARIPMGRLGEMDDIQGAVVYLASRAGAYVTGTTLVVDGGWLVV